MGKYTKLRGKLEPFESSEAAKGMAVWYEKVNAFKLEFLGTASGENANAAALAREYAERDSRKKQMEDRDVPQLNIELEAISQLGVEAMRDDGIEKIDLAGGGYVRIDDSPFPNVKDKTAVVNWLIKEKMTEIVEVTAKAMSLKKIEKLAAWLKKEEIAFEVGVNTGTIKALANERALNGLPSIDGVGTPFLKTKLTVRGVGKNGDVEGQGESL